MLSKHCQPTSRLPPRKIDQLKGAAKRQQDDCEEILEILNELNSTVQKDEGEWMHEFLSMDGNSTGDLADLLVNKKYDAPWILRPDYLNTYFRRVGTRSFNHILSSLFFFLKRMIKKPNPVSSPSHHSAGCPHEDRTPDSNINCSTMPGSYPDEHKEDSIDTCPDTARQSLLPDLFPGLTGYVPKLPYGQRDRAILHEIWHDKMSRH